MQRGSCPETAGAKPGCRGQSSCRRCATWHFKCDGLDWGERRKGSSLMIEFVRKRPLLAFIAAVALAAVVAAGATIGIIQTITILAIIATAAVMGALVSISIRG